MVRIAFLTLLSFQIAISGFELRDHGARSSAMGGASASLAGDVWSTQLNPAGLSKLSGSEIGVSYSPQPFGLAELSDVDVAAASNTSFGTIGIEGHRFGFSLYRELTASFAFARTFEGIGLGIAANYYSVTIERYGSASTFGFDLGIHVQLLDELQWGLVAHNLNAPTIGAANEKLPQEYIIGVAYVPNNRIRLTFDLQKETQFDPSQKFGFEYWPVDVLAFRAGFADNPSNVSGGLGIHYSSFQFDYAVVHHQDLGWTYTGTLSIRVGGDHE